MTTAWPEVSLGDICTLNYGKSLPASGRSGEGWPVFGSNGEVGRHAEALTVGPAVVVGRKGSFGEVHYAAGPCWPIDTTYYVDQGSTTADLRWLFYRMRSLGLTSLNRAAAIPGLNREDAYRQRLLLPPFDEQRRIAAVLDQADELRAKRRRSLALLDSLNEPIFFNMFGNPFSHSTFWPTGRIGDLVDRFVAGKSIDTNESDCSVASHWVLKVSAVTAGRFIASESKPVPPAYVPLREHYVHRGDLLFSRANTEALVGASVLVDEVPDSCVLSDKLWRFVWRPDAAVLPHYVWKYLQLPATRRTIASLATGTSGSMKNVSQTKLMSLPIPLPPLDVQVQFSDRLASVGSLVRRSRKASEELDALFASLQHRAFAGQL